LLIVCPAVLHNAMLLCCDRRFLTMFIGLVTQSGALDQDQRDANIVSILLIGLALVSVCSACIQLAAHVKAAESRIINLCI
jgi:hypothetical protein